MNARRTTNLRIVALGWLATWGLMSGVDATAKPPRDPTGDGRMILVCQPADGVHVEILLRDRGLNKALRAGGCIVDDGIDCTTDRCDEQVGCVHEPVHTECDDGLHCNGVETCDTAGGCMAGTLPNCDDGVGCTDDSCNEDADSCDNVANDANCDNGLWCDGPEHCSVEDDCLSGRAPDCDDGVSCTDDACNEDTDSCDNVANDAHCGNGLWCDGAETCHAMQDCQAGTAPDCDDGVDCTDDSCNEDTDSCDNVANDAHCDNGLWCDGAETCDPFLDCQPGTAPDCDDGVGCTDDLCNEDTDNCNNVANDGLCNDGTDCTQDICAAESGCEYIAIAAQCDDDVECTDGECVPFEGCRHSPNDDSCQDGLFCNGAESCDPTDPDATLSGCVAGEPACDDGFECTVDECDEEQSACANTPDDAVCVDANDCNGIERCDPESDGADETGCVASEPLAVGSPCVDGNVCTRASFCNEANECQPDFLNMIQCGELVNLCMQPCDPVQGCLPILDGTPCGVVSGPGEIPMRVVGPKCSVATVCVNGQCADDPTVTIECSSDSDCDDGNACNGREFCEDCLCQQTLPPLCFNINDSCLYMGCNPSTGACDVPTVGVPCEEGQVCLPDPQQLLDVWVCVGDGSCTSDEDCDDDNRACTDDVCVNGTCQYLDVTRPGGSCAGSRSLDGCLTCRGTCSEQSGCFEICGLDDTFCPDPVFEDGYCFDFRCDPGDPNADADGCARFDMCDDGKPCTGEGEWVPCDDCPIGVFRCARCEEAGCVRLCDGSSDCEACVDRENKFCKFVFKGDICADLVDGQPVCNNAPQDWLCDRGGQCTRNVCNPDTGRCEEHLEAQASPCTCQLCDRFLGGCDLPGTCCPSSKSCLSITGGQFCPITP